MILLSTDCNFRLVGKTLGSGLEIKQIAGQHPALARPLRIEFPGGLYHVTSRGDRREAIFL